MRHNPYAIQVVSRNAFLDQALSVLVGRDSVLSPLLCRTAIDHLRPIATHGNAHVFLLDTASFFDSIVPVSRLLRTSYPGSLIIALRSTFESAAAAEPASILFDSNIYSGSDWDTELLTALLRVQIEGARQPPVRHPTEPEPAVRALSPAMKHFSFLTPREYEVLRLVLEHRSNKQIGILLSCSERTAKFHVANVLAKLGLESRYNLWNIIQAA